ncbi:hypothetical protein K469DRAFT_808967 [Zopfia rhizophila CBS 207.26]|uniref:RRM domain-containing protein n=1 Tax=Zopfia rhizophila CBS 207.26 TaxID=1314779 RepID=A0A6A6EJG3_9PEZI|nr:hypothetical protein K469DRAFT_808967 [Zopfia rhizophila CBS 207.26]
MNHSQLHGGPPREPGGYSSHDARSHLAVQPPSGAPPKINLKKAAVKVVRKTAEGPAISAQPSAPQSVAAPVVGIAKVEDGYDNKGSPLAEKPAPHIPGKGLGSLRAALDAESSFRKTARSSASGDIEADLDARFARLSKSPSPVPQSAIEGVSLIRSDVSSPNIKAKPVTTPKVKTEPLATPILNLVPEEAATPLLETTAAKLEPEKTDAPVEGKQDLEQTYLKKAAEYLNALPTTTGKPYTADLVKTVSQKLLSANTAPPAKLGSSAIAEDLKRRYANATAVYLNSLPKNYGKKFKGEFIYQVLNDNGGDFLRLSAKLVDMEALAIENLDEVLGLAKAISAVLPKDEEVHVKPVPIGNSALPATNSAAATTSKDPMDKMSAWPTQEKRDSPLPVPTSPEPFMPSRKVKRWLSTIEEQPLTNTLPTVTGTRAVVLRNVSTITSINKLQSLVWGGKLEFLSLDPGKSFALVKFMTAEGCAKFFDATENGIKIPGETAVVFVEKRPGPNSVNDVLRNMTEGDASRCVRALDADEDWKNAALLTLAKGKGKDKREVDRIKRGKTGEGRRFIEFRFANVYHALTFKRVLMADEDWEHCNIGYAKDPCEVANGVHVDD